MNDTPQVQPTVDGQPHSAEMEEELNNLAVAVFSTPQGERFLSYLMNMTINRIMAPDTSNEVLRSIEGQRYIVALIKSRIAHGRAQGHARGNPNLAGAAVGPANGKPASS